MARVRFVGPEPHAVPLLGRTVQPDELVEIPGDVVEETAEAWILGPPGDLDDTDGRFALPKTNWAVEAEPKAKTTKPAAPVKAEE